MRIPKRDRAVNSVEHPMSNLPGEIDNRPTFAHSGAEQKSLTTGTNRQTWRSGQAGEGPTKPRSTGGSWCPDHVPSQRPFDFDMLSFEPEPLSYRS